MDDSTTELCECDCLNYCGDDPDLSKRKARPCRNAIDWAHEQALAIEAERERQRKVDLFESQAARIAELEKERDALKVDAERYRWLRDKANATHAWAPMVFHCSPHCGIEWTNALCGEKLDVNVDAALQASKEPRS